MARDAEGMGAHCHQTSALPAHGFVYSSGFDSRRTTSGSLGLLRRDAKTEALWHQSLSLRLALSQVSSSLRLQEQSSLYLS